MKYLFIVLGAIICILFVWWMVWSLFFTSPKTTPQPQQTYPSASNYTQSVSVSSNGQAVSAQSPAVLAAYQQVITAAGDPDNIKAYQNVVVGDYALQVWEGDHTGGQALMHFDATQNKWIIVDPGGGVWSAEDLVSFDVPTGTAQALVAGLQPSAQ